MIDQAIQIVILIGFGVAMAVSCILLGGWMVYKGMSHLPGERFLGGVPKGQVFSIPEAEGAADLPPEEKGILERTEKFLSILGGKKS